MYYVYYVCAVFCVQASQQKLKNGKVTHLRVLLKSIVPACRNTSAVLKDPTGVCVWAGVCVCVCVCKCVCVCVVLSAIYVCICAGEILCTIHQSVMEDHRQELQPGAVIILRQVHCTYMYMYRGTCMYNV